MPFWNHLPNDETVLEDWLFRFRVSGLIKVPMGSFFPPSGFITFSGASQDVLNKIGDTA